MNLLKASSPSVSSQSQTLLCLPRKPPKSFENFFFSPAKPLFLTNVPSLLSLAHDCLSPFVRCYYRCSLSLQDLNPIVLLLFFIFDFLFACVCCQWCHKSFACLTVYFDVRITLLNSDILISLYCGKKRSEYDKTTDLIKAALARD